MSQDMQNVLLLLLRLDPKNPTLLRFNSVSELQSDDQQLMIGILDLSHKKTSTPMTALRLDGARKDNYNSALAGMNDILKYFYGHEKDNKVGYINMPYSLNEENKKKIFKNIIDVGGEINALLSRGDSPLKNWLENTLVSESNSKIRPHQNVTIITNEFAIPWFWINRGRHDFFLCETCALGMNQLELKSNLNLNQKNEGSFKDEFQKDIDIRALFINGSSELPFANEEVKRITEIIESCESSVIKKSLCRSLKVEKVSSINDLNKIVNSFNCDKELIDQFKILHFSGHYSDENLMINENRINTERLLSPIIQNSLLILDGCSSSRSVSGWSGVGGITSQMINHGAIGCLATVLPVKNDPIIGSIFWKEFYRSFVFFQYPVGQSLLNARKKLRDHFRSLNSEDPTWLFYQLIGSPSTKMFEDDDTLETT